MSSKPPEGFSLFLDRSLEKHKVADALREAGFEVVLHDDRFAQKTPDEVWLREAGARGWAVVTKDARIRSRRNEIEAIRSARARVFVFTSQDVTGSEMAEAIVKALPGIRKRMKVAHGPTLATIDRAGRVRDFPLKDPPPASLP